MEVSIYHNPRCRKSREALALLTEKSCKITIVEYLKDRLSIDVLSNLIDELNIQPIDLVRRNEAIWKEQFKGKELSDKEIILSMVNHPKLIERPIVKSEKGIVIARPSEKVLSII
jgi:arsenate reductase (glutaredoxin)